MQQSAWIARLSLPIRNPQSEVRNWLRLKPDLRLIELQKEKT